MNKKLQLSIADPCHENWDNMGPVEKGKFCGSCQKQVIDFTNMSDRQIAEFFKKPSTGSICGRFMTDQLNRDIDMPKKRMPWVKYFFNILLPALFVSKASAQKSSEKSFVPATKDTVRTPITSEFRTLGMVLPKNILPVENKKEDLITKHDTKPILFRTSIKGVITNENGEPIPFASITTGVKGFGTMADQNGMFSIPVRSLSKDSVLHVSSVGYENADTKVDIEDASGSNLVISLKAIKNMDEVVLTATPGVVMGQYIAGGIGYSVKVDNVVTTEVIATPQATPGKLSVYPNPVRSGNELTIQWKETEEGYYLVQLLNLSGQQVHKKDIWIDADARILSLGLPPVAAGSYFIVLINKKSGKKYTEKIIVQ